MALHTRDRELIRPQWQARLEDPLSPAARSERRLLLALSTVSLVIVLLGLFPTKVEALGIAFETKDRLRMVIILAALNGYALVGFILYAWSDLHILRRSHLAGTSGYVDEFTRGRRQIPPVIWRCRRP